MANRVRGFIFAVVTTFCAVVSFASDYSISIGNTKREVFPNPAVLGMKCRTSKLVYACTEFTGERLRCSCARKGEHWQIAANARFVPLMLFYLHYPSLVRHEQSHVDDVHASLARYLDELTSREFSTEDECAREAKASSDTMTFVRRMNEFRRESAAKRDRF